MDNNGESELGERRSSWFKISDSGIWGRKKGESESNEAKIDYKRIGGSRPTRPFPLLYLTKPES